MGLRDVLCPSMSRCYLEGVEQCLFSMVFFSCQSNELADQLFYNAELKIAGRW